MELTREYDDQDKGQDGHFKQVNIIKNVKINKLFDYFI